MAVQTTYMRFEEKDVVTGGFRYEKTLATISSIDFTDVPIGVSNGLASIYTKASLDTNFEVKSVVNIGATTNDVLYPIHADVVYSDTVKAGDRVIIDTSSYYVNQAVLKGNFKLGASAGVYIDAEFTPKVENLYADTLFTSEATLANFTYAPEKIKKTIDVIDVSFDGSGFELSSDFAPISYKVGVNESKTLYEDGTFSVKASVPGDIEGEGARTNYYGSLGKITATGLSDNPILSANVSITDIVSNLLLPGLPRGTSLFGVEFGMKDGMPVDKYEKADSGFKITLASLDVGLGAFLKQDWSFVPDKVAIKLTNSSTNQVQYGELGDIFYFDSPSFGSGTFDIQAEYGLQGKLVDAFGVSANSFFSWDLLNAKAKIGSFEAATTTYD